MKLSHAWYSEFDTMQAEARGNANLSSKDGWADISRKVSAEMDKLGPVSERIEGWAEMHKDAYPDAA